MEPERWQAIDARFAEALELPPDRRRPHLEQTCLGDGELLRAVEDLLAADEAAHAFLERPAAPVGGEEVVPAAGLRLGPYRIERLISQGGMGTVFLASRDDGRFERRVALKVLQHGVCDPEALRHFRSERQVLARLEHPAIARLYDAGEAPGGLPFLVMEYVEGLPLDLFCDRNRLGVDDRLRLFLRLLEAVEYAHQNLLVHGDIKPGNVLVTAQGEPKLIDFGIARQLGPARASRRAAARLRPMTPAYASPEQVRGEAMTTGSDVYALGVTLFELLTGRSPYRPAGKDPLALEEAILRQEPPRPSQVFARPSLPAGAEPALAEVCAARRARPRQLARRLAGDLDAVLLAALSKDPRRRYRAVSELAADLDRHLRHRPIAARPAGPWLRSRKLLRRHPSGAALAGAALAVIAVLFASSLGERYRAERERDKARTALAFLVDVFAHADPYQKGAERVTARQLLDTGTRRVSAELGGQPRVRAALMDALGRAELGLGGAAEAAPLLEGALDLRRRSAPGSPELAESLESVAWLRFHRGDYPGAEAIFREAIALRRRLVPGGSVELAAALNRLGTVLTERFQSPDEGRVGEIERLHGEALEVYRRLQGPEGPGVADSLFQLARLAKGRGDLAAAERSYRRALRIDLGGRGEDHPETSMARRALALTLIDGGKLEEADELLAAALAAQRRSLPADHPDLALTLNDLALVRVRRGSYAEAESLYREALARTRAGFGERHPHTAVVLAGLASVLQSRGSLEEADRLHGEALALKVAAYGERHVYVAQSLGSLARLRSALGRHAEALELARRSLAMNRELLRPGHPELAWPLRTMGMVLLAAGRPAEAEPHLRESLALLRETLPAGSFQTARVEVLLGACLTELASFGEARQLLTHGREVLEARFPPDHELVEEARGKLAALDRAGRGG